jgi:hypothetical protein
VILRDPSGSLRALGVLLRILFSTCRTQCFRLFHHDEPLAAVFTIVRDVDPFSRAPGENDLAPPLIGRSPPALVAKY